MTPVEAGEIRTAAEQGRICALTAQCERDLQSCAKTYPGLFSGRPFDATLFNAVSMANAFGSPGCTREQLETANRTSLWIFALDWQIDYLATERADVDAVVAECLAAGRGEPPDGDVPLARFLTDIRERLATSPSFGAFEEVWTDELRRMLAAMAREWDWQAARTAEGKAAAGGGTRPGAVPPGPSLDDYLANADNFGSTFVNAGHWIFNSEPGALARLDALLEASRDVQQVLRLLNDLATYRRDVAWGDLNALLLGADRETVTARIAELVERCRERLGPLRGPCPAETAYLERQIGYSMGFYGGTDYWGEL
ncbi:MULTISPECIES: terpene synthase family protein [Actinomadura]|uniref:Terpene synthase family protein n=1 Tax=Actinomadura yumaensis TaxID=111807 RepID=A0ABW2CG15_9ACTN|nr:terpene synthase family protein [Actinomadura sp. J1-007]